MRWVLLLILITSFLFQKEGSAAENISTVVLHVHEQRVEGPKHKLGMIHGINDTQPNDEEIKALGLSYWRSGRTDAEFVKRIHDLETRYQFVLADTWGFGKDMRAPHENVEAWSNLVRQLTRQMKGQVDVWEIWNEPDLKHFWKFSRSDYFKTWEIAYRILREELGKDALIAGPSLAKFDPQFMTEFLDFAVAQGLEVNVLSWHEINDRISAIPEHAQYVRDHILSNPKYASLNIQKIQIDEYGGRGSQYQPANILTYLWQIERAKVDAAAKACWPNLKETIYYCDTDTLSGLLTDDLSGKRAGWWLYQKYDESLKAQRHKVTGQKKWLPAISWSDEKAKHVLFGLAQASNAPETIVVQVQGKTNYKSAYILKNTLEERSLGFERIDLSSTYQLQAGEVIWLSSYLD